MTSFFGRYVRQCAKLFRECSQYLGLHGDDDLSQSTQKAIIRKVGIDEIFFYSAFSSPYPWPHFLRRHALVTTATAREMLTFFAQRDGITNLQQVRSSAPPALAPPVSNIASSSKKAGLAPSEQMTPAARAIVCAEFAAVGAPCPVEEP